MYLFYSDNLDAFKVEFYINYKVVYKLSFRWHHFSAALTKYQQNSRSITAEKSDKCLRFFSIAFNPKFYNRPYDSTYNIKYHVKKLFQNSGIFAFVVSSVIISFNDIRQHVISFFCMDINRRWPRFSSSFWFAVILLNSEVNYTAVNWKLIYIFKLKFYLKKLYIRNHKNIQAYTQSLSLMMLNWKYIKINYSWESKCCTFLWWEPT
jgi:hypothetical protein